LAHVDCPVQLVLLEEEVDVVLEVQLVPWALMVNLVPLEVGVCQVLMGLLDQRGRMEIEEKLVQLVLRESMVMLVGLVLQVCKD